MICDPVGTLAHLAARVPGLTVGALVCAAGVGGSLYLTGESDEFGGCGIPGGDLYQVVEVLDDQNICVVPEEPPITVK